jgi:hypothetical protein
MQCNPEVVKEPELFGTFFTEELEEYKRLTKIKLSKEGAKDARTVTETSSLGRQMTLGVDDLSGNGRDIGFRRFSISFTGSSKAIDG